MNFLASCSGRARRDSAGTTMGYGLGRSPIIPYRLANDNITIQTAIKEIRGWDKVCAGGISKGD
jgi:hypothetical protein